MRIFNWQQAKPKQKYNKIRSEWAVKLFVFFFHQNEVGAEMLYIYVFLVEDFEMGMIEWANEW